jgi:hypothetical protein
MSEVQREIDIKLNLIRSVLGGNLVLRLRGTDWFSWITCGGSNVILLAAEIGVAEVLITSNEAWILTNDIEAQRLCDEQLYVDFNLHVSPWASATVREDFIKQIADGRRIVSDRPKSGEQLLPQEIVFHKRCLLAPEIERYRRVGEMTAKAMTEALSHARPDWSEDQLAGAGAEALYARGITPTLVLAAGEKRLPLYRHPTPTDQPLGAIAVMVFCARARGLYANITRFVSFGKLSAQQKALHRTVIEVEADALEMSHPGTALNAVYRKLAESYERHGHPNAIREHHQGGSTGYLSREVVATPDTIDLISVGTAVAWNPSLKGAKIEDTFIVQAEGIENLTFDEKWPYETVRGIERPLILEK